MKIKNLISEKIKSIFERFALSAVVYAEEYLGSGAGQVKKEIAINYLVALLPGYLKPFAAVFKQVMSTLADKLIEKAVEKLHKLQKIEAV